MANGKQHATAIIRTLREHGFQAYLCGGCVRDLLLAREPADYDVATDALPEEVMRIFPETYAVGAQFGVVLVPGPKTERQVQQLSETRQSKPCHSELASVNDEPAVPGHYHKSCVEVATF